MAFGTLANAQDEQPVSMEYRAWQLLGEGDTALTGPRPDWLHARKCYEQILGMQSKFYSPHAHAGLAALARSEGHAWRGLDELRLAKQLLQNMAAESPITKGARCVVSEETALCYMTLGLLDQAEVAVGELILHAAAGEPKDRLAAALAQTDLYLALGDTAGALRETSRALADAEVITSADAAVPALTLRRLTAQRGVTHDLPGLAAIAASFADLLKDKRLDASLRTRVALTTAETWLASGDLKRARECCAELQKMSFANLQLEAEVRAQLAKISLAEGRPRQELAAVHAELADVVKRQLDNWRTMPLREGGHGTFHFDARRNTITTLLSLDVRTLDPDASMAAVFAHIEGALSLGTASRRFGGKPPDLDTVRGELVPKNGGILVHALSADCGHLLLIDAEGMLHDEFSLDQGFRNRAKAWLRTNESLPDAADRSVTGVAKVRRLGEQLADRLLSQQVRQRMASWQRVVLIGDERTSILLQSLPWQQSWICLEKALVHVPSATLAHGLRQRAARRAEVAASSLDLAIVGDPPLAPATVERWWIDRINLEPKRRTAISAGLPADRVHTWWADQATAAALADPRLVSARAMLVFTHGVQDYDRERSAGMVLAEPGGGNAILHAEAVEKLSVPPLTVLAVCGASAGPLRIGDDGASHLGGAFLQAGADAVVLARGDLSLGATIDLLNAMFTEWSGGQSAAEALRLARRVVASKPERAHPHFFTGLRLLGVDVAAPKK